MRRRLDLAAALVFRPPVLFLDEPTTGLDPRSRLALWETIEGRVAQGTTVLLTTQYLDEADRLADQIVVIDHGKVIAEGTSDELKSQIGGERLEVALEDLADAERAVAALSEMCLERPTLDGRTVSAPVHQHSGVIAEAVRRLDAAGVGIDDIGLHRPTLDDVFISLTGHAAAVEPTNELPIVEEVGRMSSLALSVSDTLVLARRNLKRIPRQPDLLIAYTIQPVMFTLLFVYVFGGAIDSGPFDYVDFLIPGIIVQSIAFGGFVTALGLSEDVQKGLIDRFRSLPMSRAAVLTGRTFSDIVLNCLSLVVLFAVGFAAGFNFHDATAGDIVLGIVLVLLLGYAFSWIFALVGLFSSSPETANSIGFTLIFPLTFASSVFVPAATMPDGLRQFAEANPFTTVADAMRSLWLGHAGAHRRVDVVRVVLRADRDLRAARGVAVPPGAARRGLKWSRGILSHELAGGPARLQILVGAADLRERVGLALDHAQLTGGGALEQLPQRRVDHLRRAPQAVHEPEADHGAALAHERAGADRVRLARRDAVARRAGRTARARRGSRRTRGRRPSRARRRRARRGSPRSARP